MLVTRVLQATARGLRTRISLEAAIFTRFHCSKPSSSLTALVQRLIREPNSSIKSVLDSEETSTLGSFDFSWNHLIKALKSSCTSKAQLALEWRMEKMVERKESDPDRYAELISLCEEFHNVTFAMRIFMLMESSGVKPTSDVFNSLIAVCLSSRKQVTAVSLFEVMQNSQDFKPNTKTYNAFISAYSKSGNVKAMRNWASAKLDSGFSADLRFYESLISGYVEARDFDGASRCHEEMVTCGIIPSTFILENLLHGFCVQGSFCRVETFIKFMLESGNTFSTYMVERLAKFYSASGKVEDLEALLQCLSAANQSSEVLSRVHCGIINMYALTDRLDDLEYSVGRMLKQGIPFKLADDVEKIICAYFRRSAYDRLEMFLEHISTSYQFSKSTYDLLVAGYRRAGISEKLDSVLNNLDWPGLS